MRNKYKKELDSIVWSFSTLHMYEICPYAFYQHKIEKEKGESNFYAENGKLIHEIFQKLEKGEMTLEQAPGEYIDGFGCIENYTKKSTMDKTFEACLDYLCCCDELAMENYEIVWVEQRVNFKVWNRPFTGFIDLLLRNKSTGRLVLVDHKSADPFFKKQGGVLKSQEESFQAYSHQMYLYCKGIFEVLGEFPDKIVWHHFKNNGELTVIDFSAEEYEKTKDWAKKLIQKIYRDSAYSERRSYLQCHELCNYRSTCEYLN